MYVEEFITKNCGKRSADLPANQIESLPQIKRERGEKRLFAPLYTRFAFERWIAVIQLRWWILSIKQTEPYGPLHDGEPEPCGRWR